MKLLHTSITVKNMDESLKFYTEIFGMKFVRRREIPENNAEIAFIEDPNSNHQLELTWWKNKDGYAEGDQLDHFAFQVNDVVKEINRLRKLGVEIAKEPYSLKGSDHKIAFVKDPNGIWIELIDSDPGTPAR